MTILCYHAVDPEWQSPLAVPPDVFASHCEWLARRRRVVDLAEAVQMLDSSWRLPRGVTALTFDDGFRGLHDHALPLLTRTRLQATVFLVAETLTPGGRSVDWVETAPPWPLTTLTVEQVLEMQDAGVRFGSHTWAHRKLPMLSEEECVRDLRDSRELLEEILDRPVPFLAYPRGMHDAVVRRAAARGGYTHAFTLPETREPIGRYAVPRVGIYPDNGLRTLAIKTSRAYLRVRTGAGFTVLAGGRAALGRGG
jgi:peptidoglycan/xylan/chitin deacetylase (PgdA/CDA1 family)